MQNSGWTLCAAAAVGVTCGFSVAGAATLAAVPMQGGMVMPMIAYQAEHDRLRATMPAEIPELIPLLVSHPADQFDPADPWFDALDPSRQGRAFSRRYGFVMDTMTDPLPSDRAIWLRRISGSPELSFHQYSGSVPKLWEPIFGTADTPDARYWNGMMFHPGVSAPPGTNSLTATFEAYLVDTTSGQAIPNSGTGPMVFQWTCVPDGRPMLESGTRFIVTWPLGTSGYELESADSLSAAEWMLVTNAPVMLDGRPAVVLEAGASCRFYRMRKLP
jgi:hypothetical protein